MSDLPSSWSRAAPNSASSTLLDRPEQPLAELGRPATRLILAAVAAVGEIGLDRPPPRLESGLGPPGVALDLAENLKGLPRLCGVAEGLLADDGPLHLAPGLVEPAELLK